jgi:hypothetical protein
MTKPTSDLLADLRAARDHHAQEAERLSKAIEALEGKPVEAQPIPVTPTVLPYPMPSTPAWPAPNPIWPWHVRQDHGGMCACPECVPNITCTTTTGTLRLRDLSADGTTFEILSGDLTQGRDAMSVVIGNATRYTVS